ncbi:MAG: extracellular solute-binding protein [Acidimicrobiia bacterium]|nr:extracellular solute-binding protein [Acidimicrobiia bacterium]
MRCDSFHGERRLRRGRNGSSRPQRRHRCERRPDRERRYRVMFRILSVRNPHRPVDQFAGPRINPPKPVACLLHWGHNRRSDPRRRVLMADGRDPISRRDFVKLAGKGALVAGAMPAALAACGEDAPPETVVVTETVIEERIVTETETVIEEKIVEVAGEAPTTTLSPRDAGLAAENGADLLIYAPPGREVPTQWPGYLGRFPQPQFAATAGSFASLGELQLGAIEPDIWNPCFAVFDTAVSEGLVQPWDTSLIPNFADLNPNLTAATSRDGNQYAIPLLYGLAIPIYRADLYTPKENSYSILFDEDLAGKVTWTDSAEWFVVAGKLPENNVANPLDPTEEELDRLVEFMKRKIRIVPAALYSDLATNQTDLATGNIVASYVAPTQWIELTKQGVDIAFITPDEGFIGFSCGYFLMADADQYYHAHEWVNAAVSVEAALTISNKFNFGNSNLKATAVDNPLLVDVMGLGDPAALDGVSLLDKMQNIDRLNDAWIEVKAAAGV